MGSSLWWTNYNQFFLLLFKWNGSALLVISWPQWLLSSPMLTLDSLENYTIFPTIQFLNKLFVCFMKVIEQGRTFDWHVQNPRSTPLIPHSQSLTSKCMWNHTTCLHTLFLYSQLQLKFLFFFCVLDLFCKCLVIRRVGTADFYSLFSSYSIY